MFDYQLNEMLLAGKGELILVYYFQHISLKATNSVLFQQTILSSLLCGSQQI